MLLGLRGTDSSYLETRGSCSEKVRHGRVGLHGLYEHCMSVGIQYETGSGIIEY